MSCFAQLLFVAKLLNLKNKKKYFFGSYGASHIVHFVELNIKFLLLSCFAQLFFVAKLLIFHTDVLVWRHQGLATLGKHLDSPESPVSRYQLLQQYHHLCGKGKKA